MGFYAGSIGAGDTEPAASFDMPPASIATGTITGSVSDGDSGDPVPGLTVTLDFAGSGVVNPTTTTADDGTFELDDIPQGDYAKLSVRGDGYRETQPVSVGPGTTDVQFHPRKNWAGPGTGSRISDSNGLVYPGCAPAEAIDGSQASGWSTNAGTGTSTDPANGFSPKHIVIDLGRMLHVTGLAVDPSSTCGDDASSSTAGYTVETSATGASGSWSTPISGSFTEADNGLLNDVPVDADGVQFIRFTITSDQVPDFSSCEVQDMSGCHYVDLSEVQVHGVPD
jgi:hypothetical protein